MDKDWSQYFDIVYKKYLELADSMGVDQRDVHKLGFAKFLNISQGKRNAWERGQWPSAPDLAVIADKLGFSYRWLVTGEGDPFEEGGPVQPAHAHETAPGAPVAFPTMPMVGLASCGVEGFEQIMPFAVAAAPPHFGPNSLAVVASGESMVPAGIASGQVCYCDPEQTPLPGEAVFLRRKDGLGALKCFFGQSPEHEGMTRFKGWLVPNGDGKRREFLLDVLNEDIDCIAPVVLVRRRL